MLIPHLPFLVCLFWTAVLALEWRSANAAKHVLAVFMAVCAVLYGCHAVYFVGDSDVKPFASCVYPVCNLAVFPLYYIYVCRLTSSSVRLFMGGGTKTALAILLLPALLIGLWATTIAIFFPDSATANHLRHLISRLIFFLQLLPISYFGFRRLRNFDRVIENFYSNTEWRSLKQTRRLMIVLLICSVCSGIANHIGRDYFLANPPLLAVPSLLFSFLLFAVGYVGVKQNFSIDELERDIEHSAIPDDIAEETDCSVNAAEPTDNVSALSTDKNTQQDKATVLATSISRIMTNERLFLNPDLRLSDLAHRIGVGRTALSNTINQVYEQSFSDYVNAMRIEYAKRLIDVNRQTNTLSIAQISERSGFTSESSFYRVFRKHTGMTPRQWAARNA